MVKMSELARIHGLVHMNILYFLWIYSLWDAKAQDHNHIGRQWWKVEVHMGLNEEKTYEWNNYISKLSCNHINLVKEDHESLT